MRHGRRKGERIQYRRRCTGRSREWGVGRIAPTGEIRQLRALREGGTKCHVATLVESDSEAESDGEGGSDGDDSMGEHEGGGGGTPADLAAEIGREYRHTCVLLAPAGIAPTPDARVLGWKRPATTEEARLVRLDGAKTRAVRDTFAAQEWENPRVFAAGGRYEYMVKGMTPSARLEQMRSIAEGMRHRAIPQREAHHLCVTMHHGHSQGCYSRAKATRQCAHIA